MPVLRLQVCAQRFRRNRRPKILNYKHLGLALLAATVACFMVSATVGAMMPGKTTEISGHPKTTEIRLIGGAIHYDFLLPLNTTTRTKLGWLADAGVALDHPDARWLVVGWGAHGFYTTVGRYTDVRPGAVWRGLTGDTSVMRIDLAGEISDPSTTLSVSLSDAQYAALLEHIENSFANGAATPPLQIEGLSDFDHFFAAKGRFNIANTCNVWIGQSLRAAGLKFGLWTPLSQTVQISHTLYLDR